MTYKLILQFITFAFPIVSAPGEIMIQGDVVDEVIDLIQEQFKISDDVIDDVGDIEPAGSGKGKK